MPTIQFIGRVHPAGFHLTLNEIKPVKFVETTVSLTAEVTVSIVDSAVNITCEYESQLPDYFMYLYVRVLGIVSVYVNLAAFDMGAGATVIIDRWIDENSETKEIALVDPKLKGLCTAYSGGFLEHAIQVVLREPPIIMALNDLIITQTWPDHALINCARSVEAIRQMIAGYHLTPEQQWPKMRNALNVDRKYIEGIMKYSLDHRHGKPMMVAADVVQDICRRSWRIMDRFLHYRMRSNLTLPLSEFPMLTG